MSGFDDFLKLARQRCLHCCYADECDGLDCDKVLDQAQNSFDEAADLAYDRQE